jgi:anaerobic selenocysteine-containing dehydrogenase
MSSSTSPAARRSATSADVRRTACNRDCPDACSILVSVERTASGDEKAVRLAGDLDDPVTRGFLCERTAKFLARQYAEDRFTRPMLRRDGRLEPIGWDDALDLAAARLARIRAESGPAAILHYRSGGSLGLLKNAADFLFERFGPVTIKRGDICSGAGEEANLRDFGVSDSSDLFDLGKSRLIVVWGKNVHTSGPHLLPLLNDARRRGVAIVGIDPIRTRVAGMCDLFLQPRPGADAAIALAAARRSFEGGGADPEAERYCRGFAEFRGLALARTLEQRAAEAGLEPAELRRFVDLFATTKPAAILVGWGLGRRRNGSATIRALDALALVSGNVGVPGGGASYYFARRSAFDLSDIRGEAAAPRTFLEPKLGEEVLAAKGPPLRAIWVTAGNPVTMLPDSGTVKRAFEKTEFVVVVDTHPTDTTDVAHLVLPCLTLLEDDDLLGAYGNHWLRASKPAVAPPGEARHEIAILRGLAERLGLADVFPATVAQWKEKLLRKVAPHGIDAASLAEKPARNPLAPVVLFEGRRFPTPDGRARLLDHEPDPPPATDPRFPLLLFAGSTPKGQSSQWCEPIERGPPEVRVHPDSAAGFADGSPALLESRLARLPVLVRHDRSIHRTIAWMEKGGQLRDARCANLLVRALESDAGGGAAYYDEPVRLVAT